MPKKEWWERTPDIPEKAVKAYGLELGGNYGGRGDSIRKKSNASRGHD